MQYIHWWFISFSFFYTELWKYLITVLDLGTLPVVYTTIIHTLSKANYRRKVHQEEKQGFPPEALILRMGDLFLEKAGNANNNYLEKKDMMPNHCSLLSFLEDFVSVNEHQTTELQMLLYCYYLRPKKHSNIF